LLAAAAGGLLEAELVRSPRREAPAPAPIPVRGATGGNPPFYDVLGKALPRAAERRRLSRGIASWYGRDFHGLATSSGETYSMHAMTTAHDVTDSDLGGVTNLARTKARGS
jgi:rare lipoprotein A (peptidoglycan hydrolase)